MTKQQILDQGQYKKLQNDIAILLNEAKEKIQNLTNATLAQCYWDIGKRIEGEGLTENANYKNLLLRDLEQDLKIDKDVLSKALRFYQTYPNGASDGLSWSHYRRLISVTDDWDRKVLTKQAKEENFSVRQLETSIKQLGNVSTATATNAGKSEARKIKRPTDPSYLYKAKIIDVVDGDTLILHIDLGFTVIKEQRARLTQIDAPEMGTAEGRKSQQYLRDLCAGIDKVAVKTNKVDIYGRYLVDVFYLKTEVKNGETQGEIFKKGVYLNEKIVADGMAKILLP